MFTDYYNFSAVPSDVSPDATPEGAWDFAIYCVITDLMRLGDSCNEETYQHCRIAAMAYRDAYPEIYEEAAQAHYEWRHDL